MTEHEVPIVPADLDDQLEIPAVRERLERVRQMSKSRVNFVEQIAPNLWTVNRFLARRATMHVVEDLSDKAD